MRRINIELIILVVFTLTILGLGFNTIEKINDGRIQLVVKQLVK